MFSNGLPCLVCARGFCLLTAILLLCFTRAGFTEHAKPTRLMTTLTQRPINRQPTSEENTRETICTGPTCNSKETSGERCSGIGCPIKDKIKDNLIITVLWKHKQRIKRQLQAETSDDAAHQPGYDGIQDDETPCRDDLCNDLVRARELKVIDTGDSPDVQGMSCPPGYKKVTRGRSDFCQPQEYIRTDDRPKRRNTRLICKEGEEVIKTTNGEECSAVEPSVSECPVGQVPVHTASGRQCVSMDVNDALVCPEGQLPLQTYGGLVCDTPNVVPKIILAPEDECGDGLIPVPTDSGEMVCADMPPSEPLCPPGLIPLGSTEKIVCVKASSVENTCPPGWMSRNTPMGVACEPPLQCLPGEIAVKTRRGMKCRPLMKSEKMRRRPIVCPAGELSAKTSNGIICQKSKSKNSPKTTIGGPNVLDGQSDEPCPFGLVPVKTPVGRICQYVPGRFGFKKPRPSPPPQLCPSGTEAITDDGGHVTCMKKPPSSCPYGQVLVETAKGPMCAYHVDDKGPAICADGQEFAGGECRTVMKAPCTRGHEQVMTDSGTIECIDEGKEIAVTDDLSDQQETSIACYDGHILTTTETGFDCLADGGADVVGNLCETSHVMAKVAEEYICIREEDTFLRCEDGEVLTRQLDRFVCTRYNDVPIATELHCGRHEVIVTSDNGEPVCADLSAANRACGAGYHAVKTSGNQFVCRPERLNLKCPDGFTLSLEDGRPVCLPDTGGDCTQTGVPDSTDCSSPVSPCEDGYTVDQSLPGYGCILQDCDNVECNDRRHGCDNINDVRPCDLSLDILLAGCNPDCANGGTCNNSTCVCPTGITGVACQEDMDECLHDNTCQHQCENVFGSYRCTCPDGETLNTDGRSCSALACNPGCLNGGSCLGGACICPRGFEGAFCQDDKDECAKYGDRLCEQQCRNTYGGYVCLCPPGSRLRADQRTCSNTTCIPSCRNGGDCVDQQCRCPAGFYGIVCQFDINECRRHRPCSHRCENLRGSYRCHCPTGHTLQPDGHTCITG